MKRRFAVTAVAALSACTVLAGCGSSSSGGSGGSGGGGSNNSSAAPKTELTDAFHSLDAGNALTTTLALDTTASNIEALAASEKHPTPITATQANLIATAKLTVEAVAPAGKTLAQSQTLAAAAGDKIAVTGSAGGTTYFSLVDANKTLYLQVDLKGILDAAGKDSVYQTLVTRAANFPTFVKDFVAGKYVSLPFAAIANLESVVKAGVQGQNQAGSNPIPNATTVLGLSKKLEAAVLSDLTVTRLSSGSTDKLQIDGNVRDIATDVLTAVSNAIPAAAGEINPSQASEVPDKDVKVNASVTNGALSGLGLDITQFAPAPKNARQRTVIANAPSVIMTFAKSSPAITAPADATPVAFSDLLQFITTLAG